MKVSITEQGRIYNTKVLYSKGGYVGVVYDGVVRRRYDPALSKQYEREHRKKYCKKSKKKVNTLNTLPEGMTALANEVHIHNLNRDVPSLHIEKAEQLNCSCNECMLQVRGECIGNVGERKICEFFKPAPKEEATAKKMRLMI